MTFEEWMFGADEPDASDPRINEWREVWNAATAAERERCIEAVDKAIAELEPFEDAGHDVGSWDVRRHCVAAIRE